MSRELVGHMLSRLTKKRSTENWRLFRGARKQSHSIFQRLHEFYGKAHLRSEIRIEKNLLDSGRQAAQISNPIGLDMRRNQKTSISHDTEGWSL